jgi:hypothetical protein
VLHAVKGVDPLLEDVMSPLAFERNEKTYSTSVFFNHAIPLG